MPVGTSKRKQVSSRVVPDEHHLEGVEPDDAELEDEVEGEAQREAEGDDRGEDVEGPRRVGFSQRAPQQHQHPPTVGAPTTVVIGFSAGQRG